MQEQDSDLRTGAWRRRGEGVVVAETAAAPGRGQEQGTRTGYESEGQALLSHQLPPCAAERKSKSPPRGCGIMTRPALFSFKMCIIIAIINNNSVTSVTGVHRTPDLRLRGCDSVGSGEQWGHRAGAPGHDLSICKLWGPIFFLFFSPLPCSRFFVVVFSEM